MLDNNKFFYDSLNVDLYCLRSILFLCLVMELSFFENNVNYINLLEDFRKKGEDLGKRVIDYGSGRMNSELLGKDILVTPYTLASEELTVKLFGVNIVAELTSRENTLAGSNNIVTDTDINNIMLVNKDILAFIINFQDLCLEIKEKLDSNDLFSYLFPEYFNYAYDKISFYIKELNRLINREEVSVIYQRDAEYYFNVSLKKTAEFIRNWSDPEYQEIYDMCNYFVNAFDKLINDYLVDYSKEDSSLKGRTKTLLENYQGFISNCLKRILNGEIYLVTPAVTIDNILAGVNFYLYIINKI